MEPRDYLRLFRRRWWILCSVAFLGAAFAWITAPAAVAPKIQRFKATHTLIVEPAARQWTPENPETIALLATQGEVPKRVAARLGLPESDAQKVVGPMTVTGDPNLFVINVSAVTTRAEKSQQYADAFAEELVGFLDEQEAAARQRDVDTAKGKADDLTAQINDISDKLARGEGVAPLLEEQRLVLVNQYGDAEQRYQSLLAEQAPDSGIRSLGPSSAAVTDSGIQAPRGRTQRAGILGFIGLLMAAGLVVVLERLDVRIKTKEDAESAFRLPVIAEIPQLPFARRRSREIASHSEPASSIAEAYRSLRTTLLILRPMAVTAVIPGQEQLRRRASDHDSHTLEAPAREPQVYLITSTRPSEGKTSTVANLAAAFAEAGRSVLVIGADIRRPQVHEYLRCRREPGLTDVLAGGYSAPSLADVIVPTSIPGVHLVPSGAHVTNPGELLLQGPEVIEAARALADIVLVDTTPMLTVNDAVQLMPAADSVIVTCRSGRGTVEAARRAQEMLARLRVPVAGIVLVGAPDTPGISSYYYGYQTSQTNNVLATLRHRLRRLTRDSVDTAGPTSNDRVGIERTARPARMRSATRTERGARTARGERDAPVDVAPARQVEPEAPHANGNGNGAGAGDTRTIATVPAARPVRVAAPPPTIAVEEPDPWGWP